MIGLWIHGPQLRLQTRDWYQLLGWIINYATCNKMLTRHIHILLTADGIHMAFSL